MRILVYVHRKQAEAATRRVDALRAEGHTALYRDTRGFAGDIEGCDQVLTDDPHIADAHAARGIDVQPFTAEQASAAEGGDPHEAEDEDQHEDEAEPVKRPRRTRKRK